MKVGSKVITISFICSFAILFLLYQNVYFLKVKQVDIYSFVTESVITLTIFLIILNFQMTKKTKRVLITSTWASRFYSLHYLPTLVTSFIRSQKMSHAFSKIRYKS
ncbi:hypothetical protein A9Q77_07895 [Marinomonas sp. 42_23_T18]|nr:hypothetical protein A9Q77_07895 [Marinomonas sp. 42_23_T18]